MNCPASKRLFDVEWCHQLLRESYGSHSPGVHYSELHQVAERMAAILKVRLEVQEQQEVPLTAMAVCKELSTALNKVQVLIDLMDKQGLLDEHHFTFPDGDTWEATGVANA